MLKTDVYLTQNFEVAEIETRDSYLTTVVLRDMDTDDKAMFRSFSVSVAGDGEQTAAQIPNGLF